MIPLDSSANSRLAELWDSLSAEKMYLAFSKQEEKSNRIEVVELVHQLMKVLPRLSNVQVDMDKHHQKHLALVRAGKTWKTSHPFLAKRISTLLVDLSLLR